MTFEDGNYDLKLTFEELVTKGEYVFIISPDPKVLSRLSGAGFNCDKPGRTPIPRSKLPDVEHLLMGLGFMVVMGNPSSAKGDYKSILDACGWGPTPGDPG